MITGIIKAIGLKGVAAIAALLLMLGGLAYVQYKIRKLEHRISQQGKEIEALTGRLEACIVREGVCKDALESQNNKINNYEQAIQASYDTALKEIEYWKERYAKKQPEIIYRLADNNTCDNRIVIIREIQDGIYAQD